MKWVQKEDKYYGGDKRRLITINSDWMEYSRDTRYQLLEYNQKRKKYEVVFNGYKSVSSAKQAAARRDNPVIPEQKELKNGMQRVLSIRPLDGGRPAKQYEVSLACGCVYTFYLTEFPEWYERVKRHAREKRDSGHPAMDRRKCPNGCGSKKTTNV